MKTLIIALVCLIAGYAAGTMFGSVPAVPSDNRVATAVDTPQPAVTTAKSEPAIEVIVQPQAHNLTGAEAVKVLQDRIAQLEQQLAQQSAAFEQVLAQPSDKAAVFRPAEAEPVTSTAAIEDVASVLPQPFAGLVAGFKGTLVERFQQLETEPVDYDWAPLMEQRIADFISMHQLSSGLQLQSVRCKSSLCEVRGFELEDRSWNQILSNMQAQPWWQFNNSHSSGQTSTEFGQFFYMIASRQLQAEQ